MYDPMQGSEFKSREGLRVCPWARYLSQNWFSESRSRCTGVIKSLLSNIRITIHMWLKKKKKKPDLVIVIHRTVYASIVLPRSRFTLLKSVEEGRWKMEESQNLYTSLSWEGNRFYVPKVSDEHHWGHWKVFPLFYLVFQLLSIYFETWLLSPNKQKNFAAYKMRVFGLTQENRPLETSFMNTVGC